jgi:filamentous hemagglutinin family protein
MTNGYSANVNALGRWARRAAFAAGMAALLMGSWAVAGPRGEQVIRGSVQFDRSGSLTTIRASNGAIVNYSSFNIGAQEAVRFVQPSAASRVLNRIRSCEPTRIDGSLTANGVVYLVNPAGVIFGQGSVVDVAGLYAAAGNLSNNDFARGANRFTAMSGNVVNNGTINGQAVALLGRHVANHGSIVAPEGMVVLAAGRDVLLTTDAMDGRVHVRVSAAAAKDDKAPGVENTGRIEAPGGQVAMGAGDMFAVAARNSGPVTAGEVKIDGGKGAVEVGGKIDASSPDARGGSVVIIGRFVSVKGAEIDASGAAGGGSVKIGGGFQGKDKSVPNAQYTFVRADSVVKADATAAGDGGTVIVWADKATYVNGAFSVRGGPGGGNGGFVETSAKGSLTVGASTAVDLAAPAGTAGRWLLDPTNVSLAGAMAGMNGNPDWVDDGSNPTPGTIDVAAIEAVLNGAGGGTVTVTTASGAGSDGWIHVDSPINVNLSDAGATTSTLTLTAHNEIQVNSAITLATTDNAGDTFNLNLNATTGVAIGAAISNTSGNGKIVLATAGTTFNNTGGAITTTGGAVNINNTGAITAGAAINAGAGAVTIDGTGAGAASIGGAGLITTSNTLTLKATGAVGSSGTPLSTACTGTLVASSTTAGDIYIANTGNVILGATSTAGSDVVITNAGTVNITGAVSAGATGNVSITATGTNNAITVGNTITAGTTSGGVTLTATGDIAVNSSITTTAGAVAVTADSEGDGTGTFSIAAAPTVTVGGDFGMTITAADVAITSIGGSDRIVAADNTVEFRNSRPGQAMFVGTAGAGWSVTSTEIFEIGAFSAAISAVTFGQSGTQSGDITVNDLSFTGGMANFTGRTFTLNTTGAVNFSTNDCDLPNGSTVNVNAGTVAVNKIVTAGTSGASTGSITVTAGGAVTFAASSGLRARGDAAGVSIHAGTTGVGDLTFSGAGADIRGNTVSLRAGSGAGSAAVVNVITNAPDILDNDGTGAPASFSFRQDAAIAHADLPARAQMDNAVPATYAIQSDGGSVALSVDTKIVGAAVTITGTAADNSFTINGAAAGQAGSITINAGDGDDTLTVDLTAGVQLPNSGVTFNGDGQTLSDTIILQNGSPTTVTHTFTSASSGSIKMNAEAETIAYTGLEPITDNLSPTHRVFTFGNAGNTIVLGDDGTGGNSISRISSGASETVTFTNPATSITVNAGDGTNQITVSGVDSAYAGTIAIAGGAGTDAVVAGNVANTWALTGAAAGTVTAAAAANTFSFTGVETATGGTSTDAFTINAGVTFSGSIAGGGGTDTLAKADGANAWSVTGANSGTVTGLTGAWSAIASLTGGTGADTFTLQTGGSLTGSINGGGGTNTLAKADGANAWGLTGANSGTVTGLGGTWSNIANLTGGTAADTFTVGAGASLAGVIDGGAGTNGIDYTTFGAAVTVNLATGAATAVNGGLAGGLVNIQGIVGSGVGGSTFIAGNGDNAWAIDAVGAITLNGAAFGGFSTFTGGAGADTFTFAAGATFTGSLDGGAGTNALVKTDGANSWLLSTAGNTVTGLTGTFSNFQVLTGGSGNDAFTVSFAGGDPVPAGGVTVNGGTQTGVPGDSLTILGGAFTTVTYTFTGAGADGKNGSVNSDGTVITFTGLEPIANTGTAANIIFNLTGGADVVTLNAGAAGSSVLTDVGGTVETTTFVNPSTSLTVNAGAGNDGVTVVSMDAGFAATLTLNGDAGNDTLTVSSVTGGAYTLNGGADDDAFVLNASGVTTVNGNAGIDTFALGAGVTVAGAIDGGAGADTINWGAYVTGLSVALTGLGATDGLAGTEASIPTGFTNIDAIIGGAGTNTLTGLNAVAAWAITGANAGTYTSTNALTFQQMHNLTGGAAADTFTFNPGSSLTGNINGAAGADEITWSPFGAAVNVALTGLGGTDGFAGTANAALGGTFTNIDTVTGSAAGATDTLTGRNAAATWNVGAAGTYVSGAVTLNFSQFKNLTGGTAGDDFVFAAAGTVAGSIDGGLGANTLDWSAYATARAVVLTALGTAAGFAGTEASIGGTFDNITSVVGSAAAATDSLTGLNALSNWAITGANAGTYASTNVLAFSNVDSLVGGSAADAFAFANAATLAGSVDGGAGADVLDWSAYATGRGASLTALGGTDGFNGTEASIAGNFSNINQIIGSAAAATDSLTGRDAVSTWAITAANAGTYTAGNVLTFSNVESLVGGTAADTFNFSDAAALAGTINGGLGSNAISYALYTTAVAVNLQAGTATGTAGFSNVGTFAGGSAADSITGLDAGGTWDLTASGAGTTPDGTAFSSFENLLGGAGADTFDFANGAVFGTVNGGAGSDALDWASAVAGQTIVLTGLGAGDGFAGTATGLTGSFDNIDSIVGSATATNSLTGLNAAAAWDLDGTNLYTSTRALDIASFQTLIGGTGADTFTFSAAYNHTGTINGGAGSDTIDWSAKAAARNVALTSVGGTDGFNGTEASITAGFSNINAIVGSAAGTDTLTGLAANTTWTLIPAGNTLVAGANSLAFAGFATLVGGALDDAFIVDFTGGSPLPAGGLAVNGGAHATSDTLTVRNGAAVTDVVHTFTGAAAGTVAIDALPVITYSNTESLTDTLTAANRTFTLPAGAVNHVLTVGAGPVVNNGVSRLSEATSLVPLVDFANPTASLTLNTGAGADSLAFVPDTAGGSRYAGSATVNAAGVLTVAIATTGGNFSAVAGGNLFTTATIASNGGNILLESTGGSMRIGADVDSRVTVGPPGNAGDISIQTDRTAMTNVGITPADDWRPDHLIILGTGAGTVTVRADSGAVYGDITINTNGARPQTPSLATIVGDVGAGSLIFAGQNFTMGSLEKMLSTGGVVISRDAGIASFMTLAHLSDITATGFMGIRATTIDFLVRDPALVVAGDGTVVGDTGMNLIAGVLNVVPGAGGVTYNGAALPAPFPAATGGSPFGLGLFPGTIVAVGTLGSPVLDDAANPPPLPLSGGANTWGLDGVGEVGFIPSSIATALATAMPSQKMDVNLDRGVDASQREDLVRHLGIYTKEVSFEDLLAALMGARLMNDLPEGKVPGESQNPKDNKVSLDRIPGDLARQALVTYWALYWEKTTNEKGEPLFRSRAGEIRDLLEKAVADFRATNGGKFEPRAFWAWLKKDARHEKARTTVVQLAKLFHQVRLLGLGPVELNVSYGVLARSIKPRDLNLAELLDLLSAAGGEPAGAVAAASGK